MRRTLVTFSLLTCGTAFGQGVTFTPSPGSPVHVGPMAGRPVLADVNRDGHLDVVLCCGTCCGSQPDPDSGHLAVLLGNGKGGLAMAEGSPQAIGPSARKVAVGDVDGDGLLDIAVALHDSFDVVLLRGDGTGRFAPAPGSPITTGAGRRAHTHDVALIDVDGDGDLDLLATLASSDAVAVLLNDGKGRFQPAPDSPVKILRHPYDAIAAGDFDHDGKLDLALPNMIVHAVGVLRGAGGGRFAPAAGKPRTLAPRPGYLVCGDVDGDGRLDLVASHDDDAILTVLLGKPDGTFDPAPAGPVLLDTPLWGSVLVDLDGDGDLDLAGGTQGETGIQVLGNDGHGRFTPCAGSPWPAGAAASYVAAGDLDQDGRPDLVAASYRDGHLTVLLNRPGTRPQSATAGNQLDFAAATAGITAATAKAAERRRALCWLLSAGRLQEFLDRLGKESLAKPEDTGAQVTLGTVYTELLDLAMGAAETAAWARSADGAFDRALAAEATHREARWLKARTLSLWPASAGKTAEAVKHAELLLAQLEREKVDGSERERVAKLLGELRRR